MNQFHLFQLLDERLGIGINYDVCVRKITILNKNVRVYYLNGLVSNIEIIEVIQTLLAIQRDKSHNVDINLLFNNLPHETAVIISDINEIINSILNGIIIIMIEGFTEAISVEVRAYPTRSISEPDMEKVIRGSHDGFTESINMNTALIRRRVKDENLRNEMLLIGSNSPMNVCLSYIEGICDKKIIEDVKRRISNLNVEHLIMSDKQLEELLIKQKFNPYPLVRYTERADIVAIHLYQGMFALIVDTSPSVILAPATLFDHLQHTEEYRQTPLSGTYLKLLRLFGVLISLFLTPLWLLTVKNDWNFFILKNIIPDNISISLFMQIIIAEIGVEFLRMASIHTPSALSTAMGLISGILIGNIAIEVGIFTEEVVMIVALSAIGTYITPSYELGLANKISKLFFILSIYLFNIVGFCISVLVWLILLMGLKSFNKPYLYPIVPFNFKRLLKSIIRFPYKNIEKNKGEK